MVTIRLMGLRKDVQQSVKQLEKTFKIINISRE
ncbi:DUF3970 family protein [Bacillus cereus]|nr:DUF3970 family protein [Bacillus cereus]MBF8118133.1 DUF3970 family protein [Bacillus cereus]